MDLSNDLVSQFAKITTGDKDKNKETTVYGTVKVYDGITCVKIDGSDLLTPVDTTTEVKEGERVTVLIKNHSAVITGNTSDPSAGVSTTDKISGNVTKVEADIGEFKELTTENFRATNAVIENLTAKDAQIENLVATKASIEELEAVQAEIKDLDVEFINAEMANINDALIQKADIKDLEASNANIKELQADTARIDEAIITKADITLLDATWASIDSLEADIAEIDTALIGKATVEELNAVRAEISDLDVTQLEATVADINLALINKADIEDLEATYADIEELRADTARIDEALINKAAIKDLEAIDAKIDNLEVDKLRADVAEIDEAIIYKASISDLNATNATIQDLTARVGTINNAMMGKASIEELEAVEAKIEDLDVDILRADVADIEQAMINKANIADLNAANADIDSLNTQVANIQTLVGGNLTMDNMQSLNLTADKVTVDDAFIKDAMIDSVTANKLISGSIDTSKVTIKSADGSMTLTGSVQQFKDENGKVRIQIGKDGGGDFSFVLYDSTGKGVLIDEDGIKSSNAIADGLIVDSKVANNANISGSKLNIASVINAVNKDNSTTIKSNKIFLDEQNQSLEVAFNSLKTQVDTIQDVTIDGDLSSVIQQVQSNTTQINVNKGNISTLTSENTLRKEEIKDLDDNVKSVSTSMNDKYTSLEQDLSGFKTTVGNTYTTKTEFNNLTTNYSTTSAMNSAITQKANEITNTVSQTYTTKTEFNNLQIGGRNLVINSDVLDSKFQVVGGYAGTRTVVEDTAAKSKKHLEFKCTTAGVGFHTPIFNRSSDKIGKTYTWSFWAKCSVNKSGEVGHECGGMVNINLTTEWQKFTHTWVFTDVTNNSFTWYMDWKVGEILYVRDFKIEEGTKATDWSPAPEDVQGEIDAVNNNLTKNYSTTAQMNSAITQKANEITNTVSQTYASKSEVDDKIYDTESKIQQTADAWTTTFKASGGYNRVYNSAFLTGDLTHWSSWGVCDRTIGESTTSGFSKCLIITTTDINQGVQQVITGLKQGSKYTLSALVYAVSGVGAIQVNNNGAYPNKITTTTGVYEKLSITFVAATTQVTVQLGRHGGGSNGTYHYAGVLLTEGSVDVPWSPHPSEVYDGITTIDKNGVKVSQSNYNGYTHMSADGFYVNDGKTDAVKITKDGAAFTGKMVVQSGSIVPTSVLTGKVTSGQLDSTVTSDISTAKSNASTALSTANTAKSTADSVKSTVDSGKTNWNNAYNRVSEWAYGAVTGSTTIDGGLIEANTILANKIAIGDFNNYAVDPSFENGIIGNSGYTVSSDYAHTGTKSLKAGTNINGYNAVSVGKPFSVQAGDKIYVEWYQYRTTSTNPFNVNLSLYDNAGEIYQYDITGNYTPPTSETKNQWNKYSYVATAEISGMVEPIIKNRTSNANTGYIYFDDIVIRKMTTGELIVDGAVSANKISSNAITTDKLAANAVTAAKISSGAITADKISAGAITADKVAAGAITADKVAAGAIQAKHIAIGDYNNYSQLTKGKSIETNYGTANWIQGTNDENHCYWSTSDDYFPFTANGTPNHFSIGDTLQFKFEAYTTEAANKAVGVWFYSDTDSTSFIFSIATNVSFSTGWNAYTVDLGPFTDDRIKKAQSIMLLIYNSYKSLEIRNATIQRKVAGTLIVDGTITTNKLAANAITTDKLAANAVTAAKIASNAITADKITSGAITADKLAANAITAAKIAANAVTTDKLNANAVTAAKIASNAITADKIAAGSITTSKLAVKDGTNYSQLTDQTASQWGWTKQANSSDEFNCWYQRNSVARDNQISEYYPCKGGESLRVKADIFTSVYGQADSNGTATATARGVTVMIFTQNTNNNRSYLSAERVTAASTSGTTKTISSVITLPAEARRFAVYVQIDGYPTFSGTLRVRNVIVNKMSSGELIVDGSITADKIAAGAITAGKIAAGAITADKIATGAITADKIAAGAITAGKIAAGAITADMISGGTLRAANEINFVGGARIFGTSGEHGAGLTISASQYNLSGASQGFLGGNWDIDETLTVNGTSTLTGAVTTGGNLTVGGAVKSKTLNVTSTSTLSGGVTCGSTLSVTGASTLTGAVTIGSRLSVGGVLNLQRFDVYLDTIWSSVNAPAIKFGTDSYVVGHGGIHIIDTSGNAQTLRAGTIYANGTTVTSDRRKKMDIRYVNVDKQSIGDSGRMAPNTNITIQDMHEFIGSLPLTSFRYKEEVKSNRNLTHYGFLTQDIMYSKVGSELVTMLDENKRIGDEEDYTGYSVEKLLMFVCGALQEEIHQRQLLEKEIKNLKEGK